MKQNTSGIRLLDCTLRDGSYANNFQFTARDTQIICESLERAGVRYIEIGHGLGLGASAPSRGIAFESDLEYLRAARAVLNDAQIGMFYIPGIGVLENITEACNEGLNFIRIGVNPADSNDAFQAIDTALSQGVDVHLNLMKSYAMPANELMESLRKFVGVGLHAVYIVDSAGCMLPNMVGEYVNALTQGDWLVGFHGHNNLELANANCLAAVDAGAIYVDSTLAGMGRSAGNAQTEVLGWLLKSSGHDVELDSFALFDLINSYLKPQMVYPQGRDALEITIGMSQFHSGFMPMFKRALGKYDVDLLRLIWKVSEIDCVNPSMELIESTALDMSRTDE